VVGRHGSSTSVTIELVVRASGMRRQKFLNLTYDREWGLKAVISYSVRLKSRTALMLKCQESGAMAFGISANAPIVGGLATQGVIPLASGGAIAGGALLGSIWLVIIRQALTHSPELLVR